MRYDRCVLLFGVLVIIIGVASILIVSNKHNHIITHQEWMDGKFIILINGRQQLFELGQRFNPPLTDWEINKKRDESYVTYSSKSNHIFLLIKNGIIVGVFNRTGNIFVPPYDFNTRLLNNYTINNEECSKIEIYNADYRSIGHKHIIMYTKSNALLLSSDQNHGTRIRSIGLFKKIIIDDLYIITEIKLVDPIKIIFPNRHG